MIYAKIGQSTLPTFVDISKVTLQLSDGFYGNNIDTNNFTGTNRKQNTLVTFVGVSNVTLRLVMVSMAITLIPKRVDLGFKKVVVFL